MMVKTLSSAFLLCRVLSNRLPTSLQLDWATTTGRLHGLTACPPLKTTTPGVSRKVSFPVNTTNCRVKLKSYCGRNSSGLQYESPDSTVDKTTVEVESKNPDRHPLSLTGYGVGTFAFAGVTIRGSVAVLDKAVFKWKVTHPDEITTASLSMFYLTFPKVDMVIVGTGDCCHPLKPEVVAELRQRGLVVEVQDTRHACGTYNLLKMYRPNEIAAALIPIQKLSSIPKLSNKGQVKLIK